MQKFEVGDFVKFKKERAHVVSFGYEILQVERVFSDSLVELKGLKIPSYSLKLVGKPVKKEKYQWNTIEINAADSLAKKLLLDIYDKGLSVVFYYYEGSRTVKATTYFGSPCESKEVFAKCHPEDVPNIKIGKCVALCKLTNTPIPKFILSHED